MKAIFCFKISEKAEMGIDADGNPTSIYIKYALKDKDNDQYSDIEPGQYERVHGTVVARSIANQLSLKDEWVIPCTLEEYLDNIEEDDETEYLRKLL